MKVNNYTFINNSEPIRYKPEVEDIELLRVTYLASNGLIDCSFIAYDRNGRVLSDDELERRKVGMKEPWDTKI